MMAMVLANEMTEEWEVLNPESLVKSEPIKVNFHPATLEGKTVLLRWNGKHNGNNFLNRLGELLVEKVKDVKIIKSWEAAPETSNISGNPNRSKHFVKNLVKFKPHIVIGSQAD